MGPHQGKPHTTEELQTVADLYKKAVSIRTSTHQYIADEMGISLSTAAKRVMAARKAGLLGLVGWYRTGKSPYLSFKIPQKEIDMLTLLAQAKSVNRSEIIREALHDYIEKNKDLLEGR